MSVKLLTEHYLEFLSVTGGCAGLSVSILVRMPHCWKSHVAAYILWVFKRIVSKRQFFRAPKTYD